MKNDKLLLILIILLAFDVLINLVNTLGLSMLAYEVKPLISKVEGKLDSLEMPDFTNINELVSKFEPLLELMNDPIMNYYLQEGKRFLARCDSIDCADRLIWKFGTWNRSVSE